MRKEEEAIAARDLSPKEQLQQKLKSKSQKEQREGQA
jgi:hypothetical protein